MHTRRQFGVAVLGAAAFALLLGGAGRADAEFLTLSVFAGTDTTVAPIYTVSGSSTSVTAVTSTLNTDLQGAGFGAYRFDSLGGSSNNPGTTTPGVGANISTTGKIFVGHGTGEGTPITILLTEGGFSAPAFAPGTLLQNQTTANVDVAISKSSQADTSTFSDSSFPPVTVSPGTSTLTASGTATTTAPVPTFVTPFTLENKLTVSLTLGSTLPGTHTTLTGTTSVVPAPLATGVPEPASLTLLGIGAAGLLGYGWRRRKQAVA
jgi:hypothetical protein